MPDVVVASEVRLTVEQRMELIGDDATTSRMAAQRVNVSIA